MAYRYDEATQQWYDDEPVQAPAAAVGMPAPAQEKSSLLRRAVGDPLTALAKGVLVGIPETLVGLADIPTMGRVGKFLDEHGAGMQQYSERFDKNFSPEHQQQQQEVAQTKGFFPTIGAYLQRPWLVLDSAIEQLPAMYGGA